MSLEFVGYSVTIMAGNQPIGHGHVSHDTPRCTIQAAVANAVEHPDFRRWLLDRPLRDTRITYPVSLIVEVDTGMPSHRERPDPLQMLWDSAREYGKECEKPTSLSNAVGKLASWKAFQETARGLFFG